MASSLNKYDQNIARARYATPSYSGPQRRATFDPSLLKGKGTTAAKGAPLASRQIAAPIQEAGPEAMSITDGEASTKPQMITETQQAIAQPGIDPRFIIQGNGPRIDLGGLFPERANPNYDPSKAIGGENVPYKPAGFFRSAFLGDPANRKNIEAQQAQGAKWEAEADEQQKEDRLLNRIREADKPQALRFDRQLAENKAIREGEQTTRKAERAEDRADRLKREADEAERQRQERADRMEQWRATNAINDADFGLRSHIAKQPRFGVHSTDKGGMTIFNQMTGEPLRTYTPGGPGMIKDDKGKMVPGMTSGSWEDYVPPVTVPKNLADSPQVNRTTGATFGGPLLDEKLPPGGGVRMGGALPSTPQVAPMRAAAPSPEADASLLGRFRTAMPSLNFAQPSGRGYQVAPLTEGDVAQQAMEQIAYPLRAAAAQEAKSGFQNPEEAAYLLEEKPKWRFRRAGATEMSEARKAGDILRQMYAE
jgi:hypothetical protein